MGARAISSAAAILAWTRLRADDQMVTFTGSYAVGIVVFAILTIVNFVVVTKGAGRISEVSARFILDALPGKQMAIDADLNAGLLNREDAKARRQEVREEADFYGSMDGASKFVRGDAIAAIVITVVNIVGGLIIGVVQGGMQVSEALQLFTKLTIGDGLASQVPAFLISLAAGLLVTPESVAGLSAALLRLATDDELAEKFHGLADEVLGRDRASHHAHTVHLNSSLSRPGGSAAPPERRIYPRERKQSGPAAAAGQDRGTPTALLRPMQHADASGVSCAEPLDQRAGAGHQHGTGQRLGRVERL